MTLIIDAHEDIAYNALSFGRDYLRSAHETRRLEQDTPIPTWNGQCLLGWSDYQKAQVGLVFGTLFISPRRYQAGTWETQTYVTKDDARRLLQAQFDFYHRLADSSPERFRLVRTKHELNSLLSLWHTQPIEPEESTAGLPVGLVLLLEGAEGIARPEELEEYWQHGLRMVGPVWSGGRFCGGMYEPGGFTAEGRRLLEVMAGLGLALDLSHMNERSALQALEAFPGTIIASHANARALLREVSNERHLSDRTIRSLAQRGGVMGVIPFNKFLLPEWSVSADRSLVTLDTLSAHIDHICQITGSARHVALGTDFDGGFGWPAVPLEIDTIADLPKLESCLANRGYSQEEIRLIFHGNWQMVLESSLP